ncbi:MAG: extracellular solute-binding protein [Ruminococcus flavefaciens]|nr:extracellular solute-binding protein [Ruminococcus flavefaciens]
MKKLLLFLTVCITLTSCSSAGTKSVTDSVPENSAIDVDMSSNNDTSEPDIFQHTDCYKSEKITAPKGMMYIYGTLFLPDSGDVLVYGPEAEYEKAVYFRTDSTFSEYTPFEYSLPEEAENYDNAYDSALFNPDGSFSTLVTLEDHGGITLNDVINGNGDNEAYYDNCTSYYMICTYDKDGNLLTKAMFEFPESFYDEYGYLYLSAMIADGDSIIIITGGGEFWRINSSGEMTKLFAYENTDDLYINYELLRDRDGKIICSINTISSDENIPSGTSLYELTDSGLSQEPLCTFNDTDISSSISTGYGKYRLLIPMQTSLMGLTDDGTTESVINWTDSSVQPMSVTAVGEDEYIGIDNQRLKKLTPRDMSEFADTKFISILTQNCFYSDTIFETINDFNNSRTDYRIKAVTIDSSDSNALNMMLISGEIPDIFFGLEYDTFVNYRNKGIFTDLYNLIDSDSELDRDDFMPNVLSALESPDGKLCTLSDCFGVRTLYTKTSVWDKENWTLDEFIGAYDNAPASFTHLYDGETKIEMLNNMTYAMVDFIDYNNASCSFDNPDFIKILEFCNRFVDEVQKPDKSYESEAFSDYYADKYEWLGNEKILFENGSAGSYNFIKRLNANDADLTFAGYPSIDGRGGLIDIGSLICISENCTEKEGAWEFIKYCIENTANCPVLCDSFEEYMDDEMTKHRTASGNEIPPFDQQTRDKVAEYMKSCTKLCASYDDFYYPAFNKDIMAIMTEEATLYFNAEQTVETAAENIQSRVSILISERN